MQKLTEYMVNESAEFSSMENNPLIYTLIIPKVLNGEKDVIKKDPVIKNVIVVTLSMFRIRPPSDRVKSTLVPLCRVSILAALCQSSISTSVPRAAI